VDIVVDASRQDVQDTSLVTLILIMCEGHADHTTVLLIEVSRKETFLVVGENVAFE
jgi:hypothetical protein